MMRATWNEHVLAETRRTRVLGNTHYFPPESLAVEFFKPSATRTICLWKGIAYYYDLAVDREVNIDAAWCYPHPLPLAHRIRGHVAFWRGVVVDGHQEASR
jgi:uncharacterized protein (DUF427 family)